MAGRPIGAMAAARAFAARRDPSQKLALITFNSDSTVALPLTPRRRQSTDALATTPALASGTHIYDALESAVQLLKDSGVNTGSIVLLSDGTDVGSSTSLDAALVSARRAEDPRATRSASSRPTSQAGGPADDRGRDRRNLRRGVVVRER